MSGIHDMGGVPGYGRVEPEEDEPVFHSEWEGRVFGLVATVRAGLSRRRLESLDPEEYLSGYYQRWMLAFERGLIERGVLNADELDAKTEHFRNRPGAAPTRAVDPENAERARERMYRRSQDRKQPARPPAFAVGERVLTRKIQHGGHTRLPRYVQGKRGIIEEICAAYNFPDDSAEDDHAAVQQLYCVRVEGAELWGASAEPGTALYIDMWESYLEPIDSTNLERSET